MADSGLGNSRASLGAIVGRISSRSGVPVEGAPVMIGGTSPAHPDLAAVTGEQGEYQFRGLTPGTYEIQVNTGAVLQTQHVRVTAGEVAQLDFVAEE